MRDHVNVDIPVMINSKPGRLVAMYPDIVMVEIQNGFGTEARSFRYADVHRGVPVMNVNLIELAEQHNVRVRWKVIGGLIIRR